MTTNPNAVRGLALSGNPPTVTMDQEAQGLPLAAALCLAASGDEVYAVADATEWARAAGGTSDPTVTANLHRIAAVNRLLCLTATGAAGDPNVDATTIVSGGKERWAALVHAAANADSSLVECHGPQAVFARTRAAVARGLCSAHGLTVSLQETSGTIARCREIADERFAALTSDPEAAAMFSGGKNAQPNSRGFRDPKPDALRNWLSDHVNRLTDRFDSPIPTPKTADGQIDMRLRNWPLGALGAKALTQLADLQTAQDVAYVINSQIQDGRIDATTFDCAGYRRLVERARLPRCFRARQGHKLIRVDLSGLTGAVLAARANVHVPSVADARVIRVVATCASNSSIAEVLGWLGGTPMTTAEAERIANCLCTTLPALGRHLTDPWLAVISGYLGTTLEELQARVAGDVGNSFLRRIAASGLASAIGEPSLQQVDRENYRRIAQRQPRPPEPADEVSVKTVGNWWLPQFQCWVRRLTGDRVSVRSPTELCGVVESDTRDAVCAAAFAVSDDGMWPVAWMSDELVVEAPDSTEIKAVEERIVTGLRTILGDCSYIPPCEAIACW